MQALVLHFLLLITIFLWQNFTSVHFNTFAHFKLAVRQRHLLWGDLRKRPRLRRRPRRRPQLLQLQLGGWLCTQSLRWHPHLIARSVRFKRTCVSCLIFPAATILGMFYAKGLIFDVTSVHLDLSYFSTQSRLSLPVRNLPHRSRLPNHLLQGYYINSQFSIKL